MDRVWFGLGLWLLLLIMVIIIGNIARNCYMPYDRRVKKAPFAQQPSQPPSTQPPSTQPPTQQLSQPPSTQPLAHKTRKFQISSERGKWEHTRAGTKVASINAQIPGGPTMAGGQGKKLKLKIAAKKAGGITPCPSPRTGARTPEVKPTKTPGNSRKKARAGCQPGALHSL